MLAVARQRAADSGRQARGELTFRQGELATVDLDADAPFDAVVGRLVLMYQPDPAATLRWLIQYLRPDAVVAFKEFNLAPQVVHCYPTSPLLQQCDAWIQATFQQAGAEIQMGDRLRGTYRSAGLPDPYLSLGAAIGGGPDWEGYGYIAAVMRSLLSRMLTFGIATAEELAIDTLEDRLRAEIVASDGVVKLPELVSAWTRLTSLTPA